MLLPALVAANPNYKTQIGEFIYEYVEQIIGEGRAPKITGMLIDLPFFDIGAYLVDYNRLQFMVMLSNDLLDRHEM